MHFYPPVQSVVVHDGHFHCPSRWGLSGASFSRQAQRDFSSRYSCTTDLPIHLLFVKDESIVNEGYRLNVAASGIYIASSSASGAFYGVKTLHQLITQSSNGQLPCCEINDAPELSVRGFMFDISRNKVPQVKTVKHLIDLMADLKYNHLELYVEGFSYYYPSFAYLYEGLTPLTPEEFLQIERYAKQRCIDVVPCHNGLGHTTAWLSRPEFKDLAILEDGMFMWGAHRAPSTLNPLDPRSIELVKTYYGDALQASHSKFFHMNLDEPYELGHGKTEAYANEHGVGEMYLNYLTELAHFMHDHHRTPLVWGDVLNHYPETLERLPQPMIFVDWGYDHLYPFHETLPRLAKAGVSFIAAPGTSSWNSITGRSEDMLANIHAAVLHTRLNKGLGILLTDWGDAGHVQPLATAYPALVYAALESWHQCPENSRLIAPYLNTYVAHDSQHVLGQLLIDSGNYYRLEPHFTHNGTAIMSIYWNAGSCAHHTNPLAAWQQAVKDNCYVSDAHQSWMRIELKGYRERLKHIDIKDAANHAIVDDLKLSLAILQGLVDLAALANPTYRRSHVHHLAALVSAHWAKTIQRFEKHWRKSNKVSLLNDTLAILKGFELLATKIRDQTTNFDDIQ